MKTWLSLVLLLGASHAWACPCSDDAGSAAGLVRTDERYAVALVATSRRALGRFDALGRYSALDRAEGEASEELLLRAGLRLPQRVEWLGELGYASYRLHAPGFVEQQAGIGDAILHARYALLDQGMPHAERLVGLGLSALVRAPLGNLAAGRESSFGSGGAQLGLGAWEVGAGLELKRAVLPELELLLGGEAAYRFADHVLEVERKLGPRADVALGAKVLPSAWLSTSLSLRARFTGDVALSGRRLDGTAERLWSVVAGAAVFERRSRLRSSLTLSVDPPLGALSQGSTAAAALSVALGYGVD
ncbi:MAG TPA: hypothetical protein VNG33_13085 [Polyangiaceae bacterium]|nr:hypothetical protein [Polyangiaceae bacterium]